MVHYKTSHLKVLEFSRKKDPQPDKLLFGFPDYRAKIKSCRKLYVWVSNTIKRKMQEQWKKN